MLIRALFYNKIESFIKTKRFLNKAQIKNFLIQQIDTSSKSRFSFGTTIIEEDFKIPALDILDKNGFYDNDSIVVKRFTKKRDVFKGTFVVGNNEFKDVFNVNKISTIDRVEEVDRKLLCHFFISLLCLKTTRNACFGTIYKNDKLNQVFCVIRFYNINESQELENSQLPL